MKSVVLRYATRYMLPLLLMFSIYVLLHGHNSPGGGFVGGLVASAAFALYGVAFDVDSARQLLQAHPRILIAGGLFMAVSSGLIGLLLGDAFFTAQWDSRQIPIVGKLGTPLLFDFGVYQVVTGVTLTIIFSLLESDEEE